MKNEEDLLTYDFEGWPVYRMTFREMLEQLGCKQTMSGDWQIDEEILDAYPRVMEDDGMGYGVNEKWITEFSDNHGMYINCFVESKIEKENGQD